MSADDELIFDWTALCEDHPQLRPEFKAEILDSAQASSDSQSLQAVAIGSRQSQPGAVAENDRVFAVK